MVGAKEPVARGLSRWGAYSKAKHVNRQKKSCKLNNETRRVLEFTHGVPLSHNTFYASSYNGPSWAQK